MPVLVFGLLCTMTYSLIGCGCYECKTMLTKMKNI